MRVGVLLGWLGAVLLAQSFVVPPGQEARILAMLRSDAPLPGDCRLDGVSVRENVIAGRYLCGAPARTVSVELRHPSAAGGALARTASFALASPDPAALPPGFVDALAANVRSHEAGWHWFAPGVFEMRGGRVPEGPASTPTVWAWLLALTVLPLALGVAAGRALLHSLEFRVARRRAVAAVLALAILVAPCLLAPRAPALGVYDQLLLAALFAAGFLPAAWPGARARLPLGKLAFSFALTAAGVLGLEAWARAHAPPPPPVPPPARQHRTLEREARDWGARALFPDDFATGWFRHFADPADLPRREGIRRIVHVGDSMLEAVEVPEAETFTALLAAQRPGEEHLNLGISNTTLDGELRVLRRWVPRLRPDLVVLHVFPGNDVYEMDRPYTGCGGGPLFDYAADGVVDRCPVADWRYPLPVLLARDPAPYPLRVLAYYSRVFAQLHAGFGRAQRSAQAAVATELQWRHFALALQATQDELRRDGVPLVVAVMPERWLVQQPAGERAQEHATRSRILGLSTALGVPMADAEAVFLEAVAREPRSAWFQTAPNNPHFGPAGHRLYADWLAGVLESR